MAGRDDKENPPRGVRSPVSPLELRGRILLPNGKTSEAVLIWNVSDFGLGIWVPEAIGDGTMVAIELSRPHDLNLRAEVRWCRAVPDQSGFLIGLAVADQVDQLRTIHAAILAAGRSSKAS